MQYRLGRSRAQIIPFYRIEDTPTQQQDDPIITNKILILFAVIAAIKVIILLAWR